MQVINGDAPLHLQVRWTGTAPPIARVRPGEVFEVLVPDSSIGQVHRNSTAEVLAGLDYSRVDAAVGPIDVDGAMPGDTLWVEIRQIVPGAWGWSGVFRNFGLLKGRFDDDLVIWTIRDRTAVPESGFLRPVRIPLNPMLGVIAVAPEVGDYPMIPPQRFGGNMDNRLHGPGATVGLPVLRKGAGLSVGDPHAAQGDGEVCGTGIETEARVRLRVTLERGRAISFLQVHAHSVDFAPAEVWATMGIADDLLVATRYAVENMLGLLRNLGFTDKEAYLLSSLIGHLRISEVVDEPNFVVSLVIPSRLLKSLTRSLRSTKNSRRGRMNQDQRG